MINVTEARSLQTPVSNSFLLPILLCSLARQKHTPHSSTRIYKEYDYVVVGGGTAGSVVASRLSEVSCVNVLLIEAGIEPPLLYEVPGLSRFIQGNDLTDWKLKTTPQKNAGKSIKDQKLPLYAAKMLGGKSSDNLLRYVRGNRKDYDEWAENAPGWSYKDVLRYFLKLEDNTDALYTANGFHNIRGPVTVETPFYEPKIKRIFTEALIEMGYGFADINGDTPSGFYDFQLTTRDSQRCSTAKAYLVPADCRPNLDILTNATVTKILIDNNEAVGVEFLYNEKYQIVKARKEVIMSAGPIKTPQILMLSGIGPEEDLKKLKIDVKSDLPVGQNLQDHGSSSYYFTVDSKYSILKDISNPKSISEYISSRSSSLSSNGDIVLAFLNGSAPTKFPRHSDYPTYELVIHQVNKDSEQEKSLEEKIYESLFDCTDDQAIFACTVHNLQPKSRGTVTLKSDDPCDDPIVDPNYLDREEDEQNIIDGLKFCKKILESKLLEKLNITQLDAKHPECGKDAKSDDDKFFKCYVKNVFFSSNNMVGTCKMGDPRDPTTVVDSKLRVKGIKNLRVVDSSIMPTIPSGDPDIPTIMIAEKASDIIKMSIDCHTHKYYPVLLTREFVIAPAENVLF